MTTEQERILIDRLIRWVGAEKDTARILQDGPRLDADRRLYWKIRYETLVDVYYRLTERVDI
ncbi:MAG: hypothetical protein R6X21_04135 [Candidatus Aminicenantes bacterium]